MASASNQVSLKKGTRIGSSVGGGAEQLSLLDLPPVVPLPVPKPIKSSGSAKSPARKSPLIPISVDILSSTKIRGRSPDPAKALSNLVELECNRDALKILQLAASVPGIRFPFLWIWGRSGLGKSHHSQAFIEAVKKTQPDCRALLLDGYDILGHHARAVARGDRSDFILQFSENWDLLIIEDLDPIVGHWLVQSDLAFVLSRLKAAKKQIVISSVLPPFRWLDSDERFAAQISSALPLELKAPGPEDRLRILERKSQDHGLSFTEEQKETLVRSGKMQFHEVDRIVAELSAEAIKESNKEFAEAALQKRVAKILKTQQPFFDAAAWVEDVIQAVALEYGVTKEALLSKGRSQNLVIPRHVAMFILREKQDMSLKEIGIHLKRDHSSVVHALKLMKTSPPAIDGSFKKLLLKFGLL